MKKEKNYERLCLFIIAAAILAVSSIAIIGAEPNASAQRDQSLALGQRACVIYQTYPATIDCSKIIGSSPYKAI
jgi:hypothetical protein